MIAWQPDSAVLPSGASVPTEDLIHLDDAEVFANLFGMLPDAARLDPYARELLQEGYARAAQAANAAIKKIMDLPK